jgi:hypothetical protein
VVVTPQLASVSAVITAQRSRSSSVRSSGGARSINVIRPSQLPPRSAHALSKPGMGRRTCSG